MKKLILSASLLATSTFCFAQFIPATDVNDLYSTGQIGIGTSDPDARLDIRLGSLYPYKDISGIRLTYPIPVLSPDPIINTSIFEIRENVFGSTYGTRFVINDKGNVGIGIPAASTLLDNQRLVITDNNINRIDLHVMGFTLIDGKNGSLLLGSENTPEFGKWGIEYNEGAKGLNFWQPGGPNYFMFISDEGDVSIGTEDSKGYKLAVKGSMIAEKVRVKLYNDWPDFVFMKNYALMPLDDLELFIQQYSHLPNVPSADEVKKEGIDVATMDAALLQKIEELTLYVIELKKEIEALKK